MPTSNNISVSPNSGTGNKSLTVSASENTGRNSRSASFSLKGTGGYSSVTSSNTLVVTQSGVNGFINLTTSSSTTAFPAAGGTITFSGTSNLASLTLGNGTLDALLTSATVNGATVTKAQLQAGYSIPNDPGATAAYNVTLEFTIPINQSTSEPASYTGSIGGQALSVVQSAASTTLSFSRSTASVNASGTSGDSVTVNAPNGVSWEIIVDA